MAALLPLMLIPMLASTAFAEWKEKVLYGFQGSSDGYTPVGGVVFDKAGNLYGVNSWGGSSSCSSQGCGTVFELSPPSTLGGSWTETVIYAFQGVNNGAGDGYTPAGGVIIDQRGNLYGTTSGGGTGPCIFFGSPAGCGIVYELSPPTQKGGLWTETILYNFQGGTDGYFPWGNLVFDKQGNLYGSTQFGGGQGNTCNLYYGGNCGTVFKLSPPKQKSSAWTERVLHSFKGISAGKLTGDGANPNGGLAINVVGDLYGTSFSGGNGARGCKYGDDETGCGTVFKISRSTKRGVAWTEEIVHRFHGGTDGEHPAAGLIFSGNGKLFGTTLTGGRGGGGGTVFRLTPPSGKSESWKKAILHSFNAKGGGLDAESPVIFDSNGNLYGTTLDSGGGYYGTVYRLRPPKRNGGTWTFNLVYGFQAPPDGGQPAAGLAFDKSGNLYSTTTQGGAGGCNSFGCGTVFEVSP